MFDEEYTQLTQDMVLPYYTEQLESFINNNTNLPREIIDALSSFIQKIKETNELGDLLHEFILTWGTNLNIINSNIIPQIIYMWGIASNENTGQYTALLAFLNEEELDYNDDEGIQDHQPSQYPIDGDAHLQNEEQHAPNDEDHLYQGALAFLADSPLPYIAPAAHPHPVVEPVDAQPNDPLYDVNSSQDNSDGDLFYGGSFPMHQPSDEYDVPFLPGLLVETPSSSNSAADTYNAEYHYPPNTGNNYSTQQQFHFRVIINDNLPENLLISDICSNKGNQKYIGLSIFDLEPVNIFYEITV